MRRIFCLTVMGLLMLTLFACGGQAGAAPDEPEAQVQFFAMDTFMEFRAYGENAQAALSEAKAEVLSLEKALSVTDASSEIHAVNHSGGPVSVSDTTRKVLEQSLTLSDALGDALELTLYPVSRAWGFTTGDYRIPEEAELRELLPLVDDSRVAVSDDGTVTLAPGAELDLGAVAKGYGGDAAAAILRDHGVEHALLNLGGSTICALGGKPDGSAWRIAIQDPEDPEGYAGIVEVTEGAVDTSGGYERYFTGEDGDVYWHILDPATGSPARSGLISVTVLSDDTFTGDGLSTALFVMGREQAVAFWREDPSFEFVLIDENRNLYVSEGAAAVFTPFGAYEDASITVIPYEKPEG